MTNIITSKKNRIQNCQTVSNITLASVVSDPFGVSTSNIFTELLTSDTIDEVKIRFLLQTSLKKKSEEILNSIRGYKLNDDQSFKSVLALNHIEFLKDLKVL